MQVIELAFCCCAITDMQRAREFYEGVLNLKPTTASSSEHGQWTEYEFGPYALAIGCAPGFNPNPDGCSAALEVEDFDAAIAHWQKHEVKFRLEPLTTPVCRMAMIFDPDGNRQAQPRSIGPHPINPALRETLFAQRSKPGSLEPCGLLAA